VKKLLTICCIFLVKINAVKFEIVEEIKNKDRVFPALIQLEKTTTWLEEIDLESLMNNKFTLQNALIPTEMIPEITWQELITKLAKRGVTPEQLTETNTIQLKIMRNNWKFFDIDIPPYVSYHSELSHVESVAEKSKNGEITFVDRISFMKNPSKSESNQVQNSKRQLILALRQKLMNKM